MNSILIAEVTVIAGFRMTVGAPESKVSAETDAVFKSIPDSEFTDNIGNKFMCSVISSRE